MMKYVFGGLIGLSIVVAFNVWISMQVRDAERRGVEQQIARDIAKANQEIATRRERDATFDKMDARQHCLDAGLEWLFEDGKSLCR